MLSNLRNRYVNPWTLVMRDVDDFLAQMPDVARVAWDSQQRFSQDSYEFDENNDHYALSFDLPGVKRDELQIEIIGNQLKVSGERKSESGKNSRRYGKFEHAFSLPEGVAADGIQAEYQDGVLRVLIPKPVAAKPFKIAIKDGTESVKPGGLLKGFFGEKDKSQGPAAGCCN